MSDEPEPIEPTFYEPAAFPRECEEKTFLESEPTVVDQNLASSGDARSIGSKLGRFYDLELLGEGGVGQVLQAHDPALGRDVAIKILRPEVAADAVQVQRFRNEARITAQLEHPGIIPLHEAGQAPDGQVFFVMKKVQGQTFGEVLRKRISPIARSSDLQILIRVCDALAFAHAQGIVHRDLKPENIMIGSFGEVLVMDWGLARSLQAPSEETVRGQGPSGEDPLQTLDGTVMGTVAYMPPEQARGEIDRIDTLSDLYSLGAILYEITIGTPPVSQGSTRERLQQVADGRIERPILRSPASKVAAELESIVLRAMAPEKSDRYPTVVAFRDDLQHYLEHRPVAAAHYNPAQLLGKWLRRNRRIVFTALVVLALTGGATGLSAWRGHQKSETRFRELVEKAHRARAKSGDITRFNPPEELVDPKTGSERQETPKKRGQRQMALQNHLLATRLLERALQIHPDDPVVRRERVEVGRTVGQMALGGRNHLLAREAFERLAEFGVPDEVIRDLEKEIDHSENALLSWRAARLKFMIDDIGRSLLRPGRPAESPPLDDYIQEASSYRNQQTVEILGEELRRLVKRAGTERPDDPWTQSELQQSVFLVQVLGNLGLTACAPPLLEWARVTPFGTPARIVADALRKTQHPDVLQGLADLILRIGNLRLNDSLKRFPLPASLKNPSTYEGFLRRGKLNQIRLHSQEAADDFERAAGMVENPYKALYQRSFVLLGLNRREEALADALRAVKLAPEEAYCHLALGAVYHRLGRLEEALSQFTEAVQLAPDTSRPYGNRANILAELGRHDEAVEEYARAIELEPGLSFYRSNRAELLRSMKRLDEALEEASLATGLNSYHPHPFHVRGSIHRDAGRYDLAIEDFTRAIHLDPRHVPSLLARGTLYGYLTRHGKAIQDFDLILEQAPDHPQALLRRGHLRLLNQNLPDAVTDLTRVLSLDPSHSAALELRSQALAQLGRHEEAIRDVRRFLKLEPNHPNRDRYLRYLKERVGK